MTGPKTRQLKILRTLPVGTQDVWGNPALREQTRGLSEITPNPTFRSEPYIFLGFGFVG